MIAANKVVCLALAADRFHDASRGAPGGRWRRSVWNLKVGGYHVLRKWLSYRDYAVLGRARTLLEIRQFQSIARRLSGLIRMTPELNANYQASAGAVDQHPLPLAVDAPVSWLSTSELLSAVPTSAG